ncbi:beta-galactosidase [Dysgonomonas macrotermitis]|uniref:Beta-galactosidase n=1 Tax=Dysgonomonas macrotermitis TaxID=1346286 RepID=A0A1M5ASV9_9BACT|nr:beta-galactosidase [Dysgonomonas macrotermitis]SHF33032.1 Glycosyl hydrolases family 35 [Dysgonomonas macrotermitis]
MKKFAICVLTGLLVSISLNASDVYVKIEKPRYAKGSDMFHMGTATSPKGETLTFDSQSMLVNNTPVIPVMGEFHFSRVPEKRWRTELLKMKAGGITIVASYIFWIHHEEEEGVYNWQGQRNLRKFIELCKELEFPLVLRVGPWCHGECRNGGLPEWLVDSGLKLRNSNAEYMAKLRVWFNEIYKQTEGLYWKDGGPIMGVQLENEYRGRWEHLMDLKNMVRELGFDVPMYTRTGWPKLGSPATFGEIIPLYGDYSDGFWDRSLDEMPGDYRKAYLFRSFRNSTVIATEQLPKQSGEDNPEDFGYPYFTCELGGGMMPSYHRRINIAPMDIYAMALVKVGSGSNLPGYYMYHGGTNPDGKLTNLNEVQDSKMTNYNDLPVKSYDFQAPLGEFGQINPHYHLLRRMHMFLADFGSSLALMTPNFPQDSTWQLRWSVRSDGNSGYVFVNNYERLKEMGQKKDIRFVVELPDKTLTFPETPITIPMNTSFIMPFNLKLGGANLSYATAQLITKLDERKVNKQTLFFTQIADIPVQFVFDEQNTTINKASVDIQQKDGKLYLNNIKPGRDIAISITDSEGMVTDIVVLDDTTSLQLWKGKLADKEYVFISDNELTYNGSSLNLTTTDDKVSVSVYPGFGSVNTKTKELTASKDGIFFTYSDSLPPAELPKITGSRIKAAGPLRSITMGGAKLVEAPKDKDFANAEVFQIGIEYDVSRDIYLKLPYLGDVARIYSDDKLLTDNFYNGKDFEVGLNWFFSNEVMENNPHNNRIKILRFEILPLRKSTPIYIQEQYRPSFGSNESIALSAKVQYYEKRTVHLNIK